MAFPLFALGAGLLIGGAALGTLGSQARRRALTQMGQAAIAEFETAADEYRKQFKPIVDRYTQDRQTNLDMYRSEMDRAREDFSKYFEEARSIYGTGMDKALQEMRIGRESTIALSRQESERANQRARSMSAFTGLGQTSFGQQRIAAQEAQGVLREGAIREQYASQLSALESQRASGMATLSTQMGSGLSSLQQQQATNLSNIYQTYSTNIANLRQQGLNTRYQIRTRGYDIGYQAQMQAAGLAGAGLNAFGSALGSIGGAMVGAGLQGMAAPTPSPQGFNLPGQTGSSTGISSFNNFNYQNMFQGMPRFQ